MDVGGPGGLAAVRAESNRDRVAARGRKCACARRCRLVIPTQDDQVRGARQFRCGSVCGTLDGIGSGTLAGSVDVPDNKPAKVQHHAHVVACGTSFVGDDGHTATGQGVQ